MALPAPYATSKPLTIETVQEPEAAQIYEHPLVLVRPDGHVAWRSHLPPPDPVDLVDRVRGAA